MKLDLSGVKTIGTGLVRPEGVMAADDGSIYTTDGRGCCSRITKDGKTAFWGNLGGLPNGLCLDKEGNCLVANIGNGQLQLLAPDGALKVLMTEADGKRIALFEDSLLSQLNAHYDAEPFNLYDSTRFSVNSYFYKGKDRTKAIEYCEKQKIISGRFAQPRDPSQTFLERNFVYIPYDMRNAKDFPCRGSLPHHNEIAVDAPLGEDKRLPEGHELYQTPQAYQKQFDIRLDAAQRHVARAYDEWKSKNKGLGV